MGNSHGHHQHHRKNRNGADSYFPHQTHTPTPPPFKFGPSDHHHNHQHQPAAQFQNNSMMSLPYAHVDCSLRALAGQAEGFGGLAVGGLHGPLYHVTTLAGNFNYFLWGFVIIAYLACLIYESCLVFLWFVKNLFFGFEVYIAVLVYGDIESVWQNGTGIWVEAYENSWNLKSYSVLSAKNKDNKIKVSRKLLVGYNQKGHSWKCKLVSILDVYCNYGYSLCLIGC